MIKINNPGEGEVVQPLDRWSLYDGSVWKFETGRLNVNTSH